MVSNAVPLPPLPLPPPISHRAFSPPLPYHTRRSTRFAPPKLRQPPAALPARGRSARPASLPVSPAPAVPAAPHTRTVLVPAWYICPFPPHRPPLSVPADRPVHTRRPYPPLQSFAPVRTRRPYRPLRLPRPYLPLQSPRPNPPLRPCPLSVPATPIAASVPAAPIALSVPAPIDRLSMFATPVPDALKAPSIR